MWRSMFIILIASLRLIGCSEKPDASDYFPLHKGLSWQYQYQLTTAVKQEQGLIPSLMWERLKSAMRR